MNTKGKKMNNQGTIDGAATDENTPHRVLMISTLMK
jgi:hypothetical protein